MTIGNVVGYERFKSENQTMRLVGMLPANIGTGVS